MAALEVPLPPAPAWWSRAGLRPCEPSSAAEALRALKELKKARYCVCRLSVPARLPEDAGFRERHAAHLLLQVVKLQQLQLDSVTMGEVLNRCGPAHEYERRVAAGTWAPEMLFTCLTALSVEDLLKEVLASCRSTVAKHYENCFGDPEAWRCAQRMRRRLGPKLAEGEPFSLEVLGEPLPGSPAEPPADLSLKPGFGITPEVNLEQVARSGDASAFLEQLKHCRGDVTASSPSGVTCLHLAALSGDPALAAAVAERALEVRGRACAWQLTDGRTPLHLAALHNSTELVQALLPCCDVSLLGLGTLALDLARDLQRSAATAALQGSPLALQELCGARLLERLRTEPGDLGPALELLRGPQLHDFVPLYEYRALANLAEAVPGVVDKSTLLRSMSCMECWYAELFRRKASAAVAAEHELIRVWDDLQAFESPESPSREEPEVAVLAEAFGKQGKATVADRKTFLDRFHRRTGGVLKDLDWSNVVAIGGMVLACLTADDDDFQANFAETDVDLYVVGAGVSTEKTFHDCVCDAIESLPGCLEEEDVQVLLSSNLLLEHDGNLGLTFTVDEKRGCLVIESISGALAAWNQKHGDKLKPGDTIVEVCYADDLEGMQKKLTDMTMTPEQFLSWSRSKPEPPKMTYKPKSINVRPSQAYDKPVYSNVVRTSSTLTACLRTCGGEPLPNIQVVLAPYASKAHLLFTTDIDCTAMGFDGQQLYATPRAREAIRQRSNVARPEKYAVRGEWRTDARLLKYAGRGFRVLDVGLKPGAVAPLSDAVTFAAAKAQRLLSSGSAGREDLERCVAEVRASGAHGARLLLLAAGCPGLRQLLLHEAPMLRAGMDREELVDMVTDEERHLDSDQLEEETQGAAAAARRRGWIMYNDNYGKAVAELLIVNPARREGGEVGDRRLRGLELALTDAVVELDLESETFDVRGWYQGLRPEDLRRTHCERDPRDWRGGDVDTD